MGFSFSFQSERCTGTLTCYHHAITAATTSPPAAVFLARALCSPLVLFIARALASHPSPKDLYPLLIPTAPVPPQLPPFHSTTDIVYVTDFFLLLKTHFISFLVQSYHIYTLLRVSAKIGLRYIVYGYLNPNTNLEIASTSIDWHLALTEFSLLQPLSNRTKKKVSWNLYTASIVIYYDDFDNNFRFKNIKLPLFFIETTSIYRLSIHYTQYTYQIRVKNPLYKVPTTDIFRATSTGGDKSCEMCYIDAAEKSSTGDQEALEKTEVRETLLTLTPQPPLPP
ncbi:hypothetical protein QTP88_025688 [Uroleucon formosanum]